MIRRRAALAGLLALGACAAPGQVQSTLFLGRSIPGGGEVDDAALTRFVAEEIVPRLPDGFTLLDGTGFWRDGTTGATIRERTVLLVVLHPPQARGVVEAIASAYAARFGQQAVLGLESGTVARFHTAPPRR